jgi:GTP-binding protein
MEQFPQRQKGRALMSRKLPIVAIIGQTNAGKSALFNRLVGRQDAIVAREAGTTRDSVVRVVNHNKPFILVDTAGLKDPADDFEATIQDQVDDAIATADLILLVKDITEYPDQTDKNISRKALKSRKPVFLVLNKSDLKEKISPDEYLSLGIKDVFITSAEHNNGIRQIVNAINTKLPFSRSDLEKHKSGEMSNHLKIALIGRPNVGKSHLFNALAGKQQAIVAPVAGTTRDINRITVKYHGKEIELLDTAGVRRPGKIELGIEKFSVIRTVAAIEESDVCLLLMDVNELNTAVDLSLAGMITEAGKGIIIVITKWDDADGQDDERDADAILAEMRHKLDFVPYAPVIFTSAVTGKNLPKIFELATDIVQRRQQQIPTRKLNDMLQKAVAKHPPAGLKNTLPKMRYIVQTDINPPWFVIYGANFKHIHWSYKRYLERNLRENFDLIGTPIRFSFRDEKQIKANKS